MCPRKCEVGDMRNKKPMSPASRSAFINYGIVIVAFVVIQVLLGQGILSNTLQSLLVPVCCYIVMAVSLNLTVGVLGSCPWATPASCPWVPSPASSCPSP